MQCPVGPGPGGCSAGGTPAIAHVRIVRGALRPRARGGLHLQLVHEDAELSGFGAVRGPDGGDDSAACPSTALRGLRPAPCARDGWALPCIGRALRCTPSIPHPAPGATRSWPAARLRRGKGALMSGFAIASTIPTSCRTEGTVACTRRARHPNQCSIHPNALPPKHHSLLQPRLPNPCRLGGPRVGGMAPLPLPSRGSPTRGQKMGKKGGNWGGNRGNVFFLRANGLSQLNSCGTGHPPHRHRVKSTTKAFRAGETEFGRRPGVTPVAFNYCLLQKQGKKKIAPGGGGALRPISQPPPPNLDAVPGGGVQGGGGCPACLGRGGGGWDPNVHGSK